MRNINGSYRAYAVDGVACGHMCTGTYADMPVGVCVQTRIDRLMDMHVDMRIDM